MPVVHFEGQTYFVSENYSQKDYTNRVLWSADDLEDVVIYQSCFSQETPDTHVFPDRVRRLTFINCNLDNVWVKPGWVVLGGSNRRFKAQNDGNDWEVNPAEQPVRILNEALVFTKHGLVPPSPLDIPSQRIIGPPIDWVARAREDR